MRASEIMGIDRKTLRLKLRNLGLLPGKPFAGGDDTSFAPLEGED